MPSSTKVVLIVILGLATALVLVFGGVLLGMDPRVESALRQGLPADWLGGPADGLDLQAEVLQKLRTTYYKEFDEAALKDEAIDGMLSALGDPYTVYMDPEEYASFQERTAGYYSGVGMVVEMQDRLVTIVSTFKGSPAELAGIRPGDVILEVDGVSTEGLALDEVVGRIKGPEGTEVVLKVYRPPVVSPSTDVSTGEGGETGSATPGAGTSGEGVTAVDPVTSPGGEIMEHHLTRRTIEIPVLESDLLAVGDREVAHIRLFVFSEGASEELRAEVRRSVETEGVDAIILDLRSNGGGLLDEAVDVAGIFIPEGVVVVSTEGLHSPRRVFSAAGGAFADVPLYVLTDSYTASASEIVSGALQEGSRATLIGETTFGKGLVQSIGVLSNGGALKITSAVYLTPRGRNINEAGIAPDIVSPDDPATADVDECLERALDLILSESALN